MGDIHSLVMDNNSNHPITSKRHSSNTDHSTTLVDWSIPSTSELSPTSLTSSSPDLTQSYTPLDDSFVELNSAINVKGIEKYRHRSLSSSYSVVPTRAMNSLQANEKVLKPIKSKSLTGFPNASVMKLMVVNNKRSLTTSPTMKLSPSQRVRKRQRDNEHLMLNKENGKFYKSKTKHIKIEHEDHNIIKGLLNEIIE